MPPIREQFFPVLHYDLDATLASGQVFRWNRDADGIWQGILKGRWIQLKSVSEGIQARTLEDPDVWMELEHFLQLSVDLAAILEQFPPDPPLQESIAACHGLRLLRQDPWECLASFILSSTKQIVQIQQIVALLCQRYGDPVPVPAGHAPAFGFPGPDRLAALTDDELRACKMGYRAKGLLATSRQVAEGRLDLNGLSGEELETAREALMTCPGVGRKIADCVLLFSLGFEQSFPVDVWVQKALRELYFPRRRPTPRRLATFIDTHFGPQAGYAQQYLFHYMRMIKSGKAASANRKLEGTAHG